MSAYACDCDTVIEMEEMCVGVEEILQYARAVFSRSEMAALIRGLEAIRSPSAPPTTAEARVGVASASV